MSGQEQVAAAAPAAQKSGELGFKALQRPDTGAGSDALDEAELAESEADEAAAAVLAMLTTAMKESAEADRYAARQQRKGGGAQGQSVQEALAALMGGSCVC